jgi:hypothetical protein
MLRASFQTFTKTDEKTPWWCGLKCCWVQSVQNGDWITWHKYKTWHHEVCVGAVGRKQFTCGKCFSICSLNLSEQNTHTDGRSSPAVTDIRIYCITWCCL